MDLRHLRYFIAVAEEEHFTRAAERLGIQQPPLSVQIKAMERELDVQLFRRKSRGVELTHAGRALLDDARIVLAHFDRALETTRRTARGEQGRICVGIAPTAPFHPVVPRAILAFREAFPLVSVTLEEALSDEVFERMRTDRMDVAFIRTSVADADNFVISPLLEEAMLAALPSGHALAQGDGALPLKRLGGETFILYGPPGTGIYDRTVAACRAAGFSPRIGQQAPRITSTLGLVAAGLGISLVPACMKRMNMDGVTYRRLKGSAQPKAVLNLASRRGDASAVVRQFLSLVKRTAKNTSATEGG
ncbi:DNA-binding transcriptional regulator, LysR family [Rhizobiales bacterium GAS191]|jgi:DNA-binding transcriptional LysR family regulator|nr:DNA-binding transcriptional regulator, LysR family [Rhizobiales bacterium GAS188]SEE32538.1 DNA-binding transcriptional regulator, LysR family [Rhizobiales bacterium GAS191]